MLLPVSTNSGIIRVSHHTWPKLHLMSRSTGYLLIGKGMEEKSCSLSLYLCLFSLSGYLGIGVYLTEYHLFGFAFSEDSSR